ncbi:MAG: hypothetical protein M1823_005067 [Watsoniomyces obsoletus]|nr:MAG: hypothetical protein M1823_005067 [Watsoniomyces obsoletus]
MFSLRRIASPGNPARQAHRLLAKAVYSTVPANNPNPPKPVQNVSETNAIPTTAGGNIDAPLQETAEEGERQRSMQAPNRARPWSTSQQERSKAMVGPRFEQTIMEYQPQPWAAIDLIHQQPVHWTKEKLAVCDGGGGPLGHPRIYINLDQPAIIPCTYCGLPFANELHRKSLEALEKTSYPLEHQGRPAEVSESQRITEEPLGQR